MTNGSTHPSIHAWFTSGSDDSLRGMLKAFYSRRLLSTIVLVWIMALIFLTLAIISAVLFFRAELVRDQIMYATIFLGSMMMVSMVKIFSWMIIHRNILKHELQYLQNQVADMQKKLTV